MRRFFPDNDLTTRLCYRCLIGFTALLLLVYIVANHFSPGGRKMAKVAGSDPVAYFGVSHSLLFDRDFDLANEFRRIVPDDSPWTAIQKTGHPGSPFAIGYSILAMPLLGAGTLVDALAGNPADGYSEFAILGYSLTNVLLTGAGLIALFSFLRNTAELWGPGVRQVNAYALFIVIAVWLGTTVGYYGFSQMSHAATFFGASLFLNCWWKFRDRADIRSWAMLGLAAGLLSISRWQDVFFVIGVLLYDILGGLNEIRRRFVSRVVFGAVLSACWIPQFLEWKFIYGRYLLVPQGDGMFQIPPPFVPLVLFSTRNGWISWTPLTLIGVSGLIFGAIRFSRVFIPWIVVVALEIGLVGTLLLTWHGGQSFSARYLTSSIPLVALGLAALFYGNKPSTRRLVAAASTICAIFGFVFAIQYRLDLFPKQDRLTFSEYFTDKFRMPEVRRRKRAVQLAEDQLAAGSPDAAIRTLEAAGGDGRDRDVLNGLIRAYRAAGRDLDAARTNDRLHAVQRDRLY